MHIPTEKTIDSRNDFFTVVFIPPVQTIIKGMLDKEHGVKAVSIPPKNAINSATQPVSNKKYDSSVNNSFI